MSELRALGTPKKLITPERNSLADNSIEAFVAEREELGSIQL
jgi:hypothetical protein